MIGMQHIARRATCFSCMITPRGFFRSKCSYHTGHDCYHLTYWPLCQMAEAYDDSIVTKFVPRCIDYGKVLKWMSHVTGSDNGLPPGRRRTINWTNAGPLLTGPLETNFFNFNRNSYIFIKRLHLIMSYDKWWPVCLGLNLLNSYRSCI